MSRGLEQIVAQYKKTEEKNLGNTDATKSGKGGLASIFEKIRKTFEDILRAIGIIPGGSGNSSNEYAGEPVNMSTGNYVNDIWELTMRGDMELSFVRHYNSQYIQPSSLGIGWSHNLDCTLTAEGEELTVCWGDRRRERFVKSESGKFISFFGGYETIERTENGYRYIAKNGKAILFDGNGLVTEICDRVGRCLRFTYEEGQLSRVEASKERWFHLIYNGQGLLTLLTDSMGREVSFQYEDALLRRVLSADGTAECYEYDESGRLSAVINAAGVRILENFYNEDGQVVHQRFPDGTEMRYEYQDDHVIFTDRNGSQAVYYHDDRLRHTSTQFAVGREFYTYNEQNQRITYTDLNGAQWKREFDADGNVISLTNPLGQVTKYQYDSQGLLTFVIAPDGAKTQMEHDEDGNVTAIMDAVGGRQTMVYQGGRLVEAVDPDGLKSVFTYDADGRILSVTDSQDHTVYHKYDKAGRLIQVTDKNGNVSQFEYDGLDRLLLIRNPIGEERRITYSPTGKVLAIKDFDGQSEQWAYNEMDLVSTYTDKAGRVTSLVYDNMSNPVKITRPDGLRYHQSLQPDEFTRAGGADRYGSPSL